MVDVGRVLLDSADELLGLAELLVVLSPLFVRTSVGVLKLAPGEP